MFFCTDSGKGPLATRIKNAAEIYNEQFGSWPQVCVVPESLLEGKTYPRVPGLRVVTDANLKPGVFRLGFEK